MTVVLLIVGAGLLVAPSAAADSGTFAGAVNTERAKNGLPALTVNTRLTAVAQAWSEHMAATGRMEHNPNLGSQVTGWSSVGENVGFGSSELSVHTALMNSSGHRANILNAGYAQVGVGVVVRNGRVWVTQVFRTPQVGSPSSWKKTGFAPTVYQVGPGGHRPVNGSQWAAAGYPGPSSSPTEYVHYPWSAQVWAVTYWPDGWQWDRLNYAQWAAARYPAPRAAGWVEGSQIWRRTGSNTLYLTEPNAGTHALTYNEWAATGHRPPVVR